MARRSKRAVKKPIRQPNAVECIIDRKLRFGEAGCSACKASYSTSINPLTEPIDIYSEWIDECVKLNES
ncbi:hypothetical protein MANES_15G020700v8 [Manihot esculenta]|uniref:Transcription elongation factor 1 homolog n=1 Tax=Manihot esculenta TaxID=3983 RepID=A0A2C9UCA8_MANES|nr:hypothetical protein MANES_15G020700v8 [Manihot esculenta]